MSYCTQADLVTRYGETELIQLTDRVSADEIDTDVVARAIADADAEIDGYLSGRYPVPLADPPALLTRLACALVRHRLWDDRATESVRRQYEDARRLLEQINAGKVGLGIAAPPAPSGGAVQFEAGSHVWGRGTDGGL